MILFTEDHRKTAGFCIRFVLIAFLLLLDGQGQFVYATKSSASIKAGEQKKAEKGLKDNKKFLYYINASVSNTGSVKDKELYTLAVKHDIVARFYYLRFSFSESFAQIRTAQEILIKLYRSNITAEVDRATIYLNRIAPEAVYSRDPRARLYLRLAYRNAKHAGIYKNMADHYKLTLYSMRLYKYVEAMKKAKEAKRYAVSAMLQIEIEDKHLLEREYHSYDDIVKLIKKNSRDDIKEESQAFHADSYYRFTGESLYQKVWDDPSLETFDPFKEYLDLTD